MASIFNKLVKGFLILERGSIYVLLLGLVLIVAIQVFSRYAGTRMGLHYFWWTEEGARLCLVWLTFLGASILSREQQHIRMDFFIQKLGKRGQLIAGLFSSAVSIAFFVLVLWTSRTVVPKLLHQTTFSLEWSRLTFFSAMLVGIGLMLLYTLVILVRQLYTLWKMRS